MASYFRLCICKNTLFLFCIFNNIVLKVGDYWEMGHDDVALYMT